jgi:nitrite reductase/ring-hydroxylating ferredoxin subunit
MNEIKNSVCGNCNHNTHNEDGEKSTAKRLDLSRRKALTVIGSALGAIGLASFSESAQAAAKTYVACKTSQVKVKGAYMATVGGRSILITQPKAGTFRAFDPTCTHQGCQLSGITGTNLVCACHNATFNYDSGAPTGGPARTALGKIKVSVAGTSVKVTF